MRCCLKTVLKKAQKGKLTFLYVTPERLQSKAFCQAMEQVDLFTIVADECHCITEWGYTFRDAYLQIGTFIDRLPKKPFEKRLVERLKALDKFVRKYWDGGSVVIYALTTGYVDAIYNHLDSVYPGQVARCHAQMKPDKLRHRMELDFLQGKRKIMVATTAFGMGIDVPDVELVVHFHTPISMTDYIQQIGRAGRDGRKAHCVLFYDQNGDERRIFSSFQKKSAQHSGNAAPIARNPDEVITDEDRKWRSYLFTNPAVHILRDSKHYCCESLTAARKLMKLKNKDFIALLEKFRKLGISPIPRKGEG